MNKKSTLILLSFGIFLIGFLLIFLNQANAKIIENSPFEFHRKVLERPLISGQVEKVGSYFEIKDSKYLNVILKSDEKIEVFLESVPKMISLNIKAVDNATSTILTIENLNSNKTYYKYGGSYRNEVVFVSDVNGNYSWKQDLTKPHHVWIQEEKSTIFLPEDCSGYGIWNATTSTCTLNQDLNQSVEITKNNITLDCNNYNITGSGTGYGIYLSYKSGVTIRNCLISNFSNGITFYESSNNTLNNNIIKKSTGNYGISLWISPNNTINDNTMDFNNFGIAILSSPGSIITQNIIINSKSSGIELYASSYSSIIENSISSNNWGIQLLHSLKNILTGNEMYSNEMGIFFSNSSSGNTLRNNLFSDNQYNIGFSSFDPPQAFVQDIDQSNTINGKPIHYLVGETNKTVSGEVGFVGLVNCQDIIVKDLLLTNNYEGLLLVSTKNSRIENVKTLEDSIGVLLIDSSNNNFSKNQISSKGEYGIGLLFSSSSANILNDNDIKSNNYYGVALRSYLNFNNKFYHSNFLTNGSQVYIGGGTGNLFDNGYPDGGNYWSDYIGIDKYGGPSQNESGSDGIGDTPYAFTGGKDRYPFMRENGWIVNQLPALSNLNQFKSDGITLIFEGVITTEDIVVFKAIVDDPDGDQVKLEVELRQFQEPFTGIYDGGILSSDFVDSGTIISVTRYGLVNGQYHWRARAVDSRGAVSDWQEFGEAGNIDFEVSLPLSTKAAMLAKELMNTLYLYGGKGWDYNLSKFVAANTIKTGYTFWNQQIGNLDFGSGVDCSGLIMWAYDRSFDPNKSRFENFMKVEGADAQYHYNTTPTTELELQPGDVMFFDNVPKDGFIDHVAMYVGESGGFNVVSAVDRTQGILGVSKDTLKQLPKFVAFKRVVSALPPAVLAIANSPVDLVMTDPDGFTITPTTTIPSELEFLREIPGVLYYSEMERGADGNPIDQVYSYTAKTGDYIIKVIPEVGTLPSETYTLNFTVDGQTTVLVDEIPISQIPAEGYGIEVTETGTTIAFIPVTIDIKPNSYLNSINLGSKGVIPVAILGSKTFDVKQINSSTIIFANAPIKLKNNGQPMISYEDINADSFIDAVIQVSTQAMHLTQNDTKANLEGKLFNETVIKGADSVRIITDLKSQRKSFLAFLAAPIRFFQQIKTFLNELALIPLRIRDFLINYFSKLGLDNIFHEQISTTPAFKTYRNEEWGFEFKYPEDWSFHPNTFYSPFSKFNLVGASPEENGHPDPLAPSLLINVVTPDFADRAFYDLRNTGSETNVGGVIGLKYEYGYEGLSKIAIILSFGQYKMILGAQKQYEAVFNQILATFKFLK